MPDVSTEVAIATTTLGSAADTITFSSISSAYTDLRLVLTAASSTNGVSIAVRYNGDSSSNYSLTRIYGDGSAAYSDRSTGQTSISGMSLTGGTGIFTLQTLDVFLYAGATNKNAFFATNNDTNGGGRIRSGIALWRSSSAITSISLSVSPANFEAGTTATLYGIL